MNEEIMITQQDLIDWIDRSPSNDDLDLINFIVNRLENFYKLENEIKILRKNAEHNDKVVDEARWERDLYKARIKKALKFADDESYFSYKNGIEVVAIAPTDKLKNILTGDETDEHRGQQEILPHNN